MADLLAVISLLSLFAWVAMLLLPWRSWLNGEILESEIGVDHGGSGDFLNHPDLTILIPARNEAEVIAQTLEAIQTQGRDITVIVVDDESTDGTGDLIRSRFSDVSSITVLSNAPRPVDWSGKLWALHNGLKKVHTSEVLLLDADILLRPGTLARMLTFKKDRQLQLVSVMALLRNKSVWERLLIPAFVFFFKQIYPFRLSNSSFPYVAAAAGGCILVDTEVLRSSGGFERIKGEIIDDCSLAKQIKGAGHATWIGLSRRVLSHRSYDRLDSIWNMVDRTAFCQLGYSLGLLIICTLVMLICFWGPVAGLFVTEARTTAVIALICMFVSYQPTLAFYKQRPYWSVAMPFIGSIYLAMTWSSALKFWFGKGAEWKGRQYKGSH